VEQAGRSCNIDFGICASDYNGNCCDPSSASCLYDRNGADTDSPQVCSDSSAFAPPLFSDAEFANDVTGLQFATAVVQVTPNYSNARVIANLSTSVPIATTSSVYTTLSSKQYAGGALASPTGEKITSWEQDKNFTCLEGYTVSVSTNPYTYGTASVPAVWTSAATSLSAKDTVFFTCWTFPQQLQRCCTRGHTCCNQSVLTNSGTTCCADQSCFACTNTTVDPAKNGTGIVYRPYNVYVHTVAGSATVDSVTKRFCDEVPSAGVLGGEARVLFNGTFSPPAKYGDPLFAYEPNPFRSPFDTVQSQAAGARLGVPVSFSLMHSADGSPAATGSYLTQFVNDAACSTSYSSSSSLAVPYGSQCGWKALAAFWNRLAGSLSASVAAYASFARTYYVYAVATRMLLALYQLAPCVCADGEARMPVAVFCSSAEWSQLVLSAIPGLATAAAGATLAVSTAGTPAGTPTLAAVLAGLAGSPLMTSAQPAVGALRTADMTVQVTLTLPAILRRFATPSGLGTLLLRAFPRCTVADGGVMLPGNDFDPATTWAYLAATGDAPAQTVFQVVEGSVVVGSYYTAGANGALYGASQSQPSTGDTYAALMGLTVNFSVRAAAGGFTLLFYLYYLARNSNVKIDVAGLLAVGEPDVATLLMPNVLDSASAADILAAGGCTAGQTTFVGAGAWRVNALLLGPQSQACKCLLPTATGLAAMSPEAMCFNANCASSPPYLTVNLPSLLSSTQAGVQVPYDCSQACGSFLASLESATADVQNINDVALQELCGVSLSSAQSAALAVPASAAYVAAGVLACVAMPLLYLTVLAVSLVHWRREGTPFAHTLAARPAFFVSCAAVLLLLCAGFAYFWTDCRGVQACTARSAADADGFTYPASQCLNAGVLSQPFTVFGTLTLPALVPRYTLPQEFCTQAPSYCQCDNAAFLMCATGGCGCNDTQCCSVNGICTSPDLTQVPATATAGVGDNITGASGRPLRLTLVTSNWSALATLLSACLALALVPAAVAGAVYGTRTARTWVRCVVGAAVLVAVAAACLVPVFYRLASPANTTAVAVGACPKLADYPNTLVETTRPTIVYTRTTDDANGYPTYARNATTAFCASCCTTAGAASASAEACAAQADSTCPTGCTCAWTEDDKCYESPPPLLSYSVAQQRWTMTAGSTATSSALPVLHNNPNSGVLFQDATNGGPTLYASFTDDGSTAANTYTFCGSLSGTASCTSCACTS
jgi:hypothetical protein